VRSLYLYFWEFYPLINLPHFAPYEITAELNDTKLAYLHTTVETANNYHQVIAYTSQDDFAKNRTEMEEVINSFQEVEK
jgi:hypothetical protein